MNDLRKMESRENEAKNKQFLTEIVQRQEKYEESKKNTGKHIVKLATDTQ